MAEKRSIGEELPDMCNFYRIPEKYRIYTKGSSQEIPYFPPNVNFTPNVNDYSWIKVHYLTTKWYNYLSSLKIKRKQMEDNCIAVTLPDMVRHFRISDEDARRVTKGCGTIIRYWSYRRNKYVKDTVNNIVNYWRIYTKRLIGKQMFKDNPSVFDRM